MSPFFSSPSDKKSENYEYPYCPDCFTKYEKITKIGQGTFGEVFKAKNRQTKQLVALKKILMDNEKEGFPITALREIKILQLLRQENIVHLLEICVTKNPQNKSKPTFYLVFEFCEHDLAGLLSNLHVKFSLGEIKKIMQQLLNGLYFIHSNKILHRDMKAANILITKNGVLKLADFGLARAYSLSNPNLNASSNVNRYTNRVVTLWYRPPELLLGERNYGPPIDMWGAGCIMAELWTRSPIMQGQSEQHQLNLISQLCGSLTPEIWPGCEKLDLYNSLTLLKDHKRKVKERLRNYVRDALALDLIDKLLTLDPSKRVDSDESLNHDFFWTDPMPADLSKTLSTHTTSMFEFFAQPRRGAAAAGAGHHNQGPSAAVGAPNHNVSGAIPHMNKSHHPHSRFNAPVNPQSGAFPQKHFGHQSHHGASLQHNPALMNKRLDFSGGPMKKDYMTNKHNQNEPGTSNKQPHRYHPYNNSTGGGPRHHNPNNVHHHTHYQNRPPNPPQ